MQKIGLVLLLLLSALSLLPFGLVAPSAFPVIDDFPCSLAARDAGLITSVVSWYKIWTARYFAVFMWWLCPLVWGWEAGYQFTALAIFLGHFFSAYVFLYLVKEWVPLSVLHRMLLSLIFTVFYIAVVPSVTECLYYYNGLVCYQPAAMFFLPMVGLAIRFWSNHKVSSWKPWSYLIAMAMLCFCIVGSNESAMLCISLLVGLLWLYFLATHHKVSLFISLLLIEVVVLDLIVLFSPATSLRMQASGSSDREFVWILTQSSLYGFRFFWDLILHPFFWLFSLAITLLLPENQNLVRHWGAILLTVLFLYFGAHLPSFIGEGMVQGRTADFTAFIFLLGWVFLLYCVKARYLKEISFVVPTLVFSLVLLVANLFFYPDQKNNIASAWHDVVSGLAANHRTEVLERIHYLHTTSADSVQVSPYQYFPSSTFVADLVPPDGNVAHNAFYARYYKKKYIELKTTDGTRNRKPD